MKFFILLCFILVSVYCKTCAEFKGDCYGCTNSTLGCLFCETQGVCNTTCGGEYSLSSSEYCSCLTSLAQSSCQNCMNANYWCNWCTDTNQCVATSAICNGHIIGKRQCGDPITVVIIVLIVLGVAISCCVIIIFIVAIICCCVKGRKPTYQRI